MENLINDDLGQRSSDNDTNSDSYNDYKDKSNV